MPSMKTYREAVFSGWFGPMGVGAVFLSIVAKEEMTAIYSESETRPTTIELIEPVVLFIVLSSTLVHGTTIPLFKIGNRIRTRTLSIASTGSGGQVLRLPKLQFGQQISFSRRSEENIQQQTEDKEAMSQLKRNTLRNTNQPQPPEASPNSYAVQMQEEEDNLPEEDFLPDESDETEVGTDSGRMSDQSKSKHIQHTGTEPQSIRFLEPVNPRASTSHNTNIERNEASVSSFKSWMNRNKPTDHAVQTEETSSSTGGGGGGLRNLFRRNKEPAERKANTESPINAEGGNQRTLDTLKEIFETHHPHLLHHPHHPEQRRKVDLGIDHLSPEIEVWNEAHHIIVENKNNAASQICISKSEPEWINKLKDAIKELQLSIDQSTREE